MSVSYLTYIYLEDLMEMIASGVKPITRATYVTAGNLWIRFQTRTEGYNDDVYMVNLKYTRRDVIIRILRFLKWLSSDEIYATQQATRRLKTGVRFHFRCHAADYRAFGEEEIVEALKGMEATSSRDRRKAPSPAIPWNMALNRKARVMFHEGGDQDRQMAYIGVTAGFNFGWRIGEFAYEGPYDKPPKMKEDHRFYWSDILIECETGVTISFSGYLALIPRPVILMIVFVKNSSKTSGRAFSDGKPYFLTPGDCEDEQIFFDDFIQWMEICKVVREDRPMFSRTGVETQKEASLLGRIATKLMKDVDFTEGISGFSGKSVRVGGSTALRVAGRSDIQILSSVGHLSTSSNLHYQASVASGGGYALSTGDVVNTQDVARMAMVNTLVGKKRVTR